MYSNFNAVSDYWCNTSCIFSAYGGDFCEEDRNGCSEIQCFEGVECLDVPAPGVGAMCGACPDGYTGDGEKCFGTNLCTLFGEFLTCITSVLPTTNYRCR